MNLRALSVAAPPPAAAGPGPAPAPDKPPAAPPPPTKWDQLSLDAGRVVHKPFHIPARLTESSMLIGAATHNAVGKSSAAVGETLLALKPRGPAKWLTMFFGATIPETVAQSAKRADHNVKTVWGPASEASEKMGMTVAGPLLAKYAKGAGFPEPGNNDLLSALAHSEGYPLPPPPPANPKPAGGGQGGTPPAADAPAPSSAPEGSTPPVTGPTTPAPADMPAPVTTEAPSAASTPAPADAPAAQGGAAPAPTASVADAAAAASAPAPTPAAAG